jgi:60 kDa SS-A/Ro ribonucleoprotein
MEENRKKEGSSMKFNFSLRGRQSADTRYAFVKAGITDVHSREDLYRDLLAVSFADDPARPLFETGLAIRTEILAADPGSIARMAVRLDTEANSHPAALWLTAELAAAYGKDENIALLIGEILRQPADIPLWLSFYTRAASPETRDARPGRVIRRPLDGLFNRLDEFTFSRSPRETQTALREALRFLRPKAADRVRKLLFTRILQDKVPGRSSWEQEWHALHHQPYDSPEQRQVMLRDKWKEGISSFRIGYTALLDNLRPMLCAGVSGKVLKLAAEYLGNPAAVRRSGISPLRLLEVYRELRRMDQGGAGMLSEALEAGVVHSGWSRLGSHGTSLIAMDVSNSMKYPVYPGGTAQRFDIAPLLAWLWKSKGYSVLTGIIGNNWKPTELTDRPVLLATDQFRGREGEAGYGINAHLILQDLLRRRQAVDRILVFTDCRLWGSRGFDRPSGADLVESWRQYRTALAPNAKLYLFDLAGYGARPLEIAGDEVFLIAGWKEPILDVLAAMEG